MCKRGEKPLSQRNARLEKLFLKKDNTAGKIIKSFRKNFNITQSQLCKVTGISEKYLSAIENDKRTIGLEVASKIALFFGFDPSFILFPNGLEELPRLYPNIRKGAAKIIAGKQESCLGVLLDTAGRRLSQIPQASP